MKSTTQLPDAKRPYRQTARAAASEANAQRMVEAFRLRLERLWFDEIRLEDVAQDAGVTVQTVIRRFGGKDGLLDAAVDDLARQISARRSTFAGDVPRAIAALIEDYEISGDLVIRMLAQEDRYPVLHRLTDVGRASHRAWAADTFAKTLEALPPEAARRRLDALVVATDLYVWQLIRRDMRRPVAELQALMEGLVAFALTDPQ